MSRAFVWGRFHDLPPLTPAAAARLCAQAEKARAAAESRHVWRTIDVLRRTGALWADPRGRFRRRAQALMPRVTGFSPETVRRTLEIIPKLLERSALEKRVEAELGRLDALDAWSLDPEASSALRAYPLGSVLHVAAGNVFLGCIDSIVMSMLTNNATILRLSSSDHEFPHLFAESLAVADENRDLTPSLAILSWPKDERLEAVFKNRLQGIVVWGGESAVSAYRKDLGVGCKLIAFGPKLSFGVISRAGLRRAGVRAAAARAARDVSWWDQAACASPQTLFVQGPRPDDFLEELARALSREARAAPPGPLSPDEAASILEDRQRALAAELRGEGRLLGAKDGGWTVAWSRTPALKASPLRRFIHVRPYRDLAHLRSLVAPSAAYLQSAGLCVGPSQAADYAEALASAGVSRAPELGRMLESETGEPHDGRYPLGELARWVSGPPEAAFARAPKALAAVVDQARAESPFYRRRLAGRAPLIDKDDLYEHAPPRSDAILTRAGDGLGRLLFASGGSTGKPKYCVYTQDEFERTSRWLAWGLRTSGLEAGDVVANLFVAGNLWSSFMAIEGSLRALSVTHLPVGGTADPELALDALRRFKANAVIGLPSTVLELARRAENGRKRLNVEKIFYAGEHVSEEMRREWTRVLGAKLIRSAGYASVDAGLIGFQCAACAGSVHHAAQGLQSVEIVDPASGRPAKAGQAGEIVATNLIRRLMPVIRYRTGDLGRWTGRPCPCGHPAPLFALLGRCDDRVNVGGAHLDAGDVGRAVGAVPGLSLFYQLVVKPGEKLVVRVERKSAGPADGLAARLSAALLRASHELRDSVERGWLKAPAVEILAPGALPRQPRTGKIRRVSDLRLR